MLARVGSVGTLVWGQRAQRAELYRERAAQGLPRAGGLTVMDPGFLFRVMKMF